MHTRVQIASIAFALLVLTGVFELVRRGRLRERYALLWFAAALVLLVLAIWQRLLHAVSRAAGIYYPPNAFFVIAFAFVLLLLLHFSTAVSRLADQTRLLAQRLALLEQRLQAGEPAMEDERELERPAGDSGDINDRLPPTQAATPPRDRTATGGMR